MNYNTHRILFNSMAEWFLILEVSFWLLKRSKTALPHHNNTSTPGNIVISSKLTSMLDRLRYIWTSTRDVVLRKCAMFSKYRYGLEFKIKKNNLHLFLRTYNYKMANFEGLRSCLSNVPFENGFSDDINIVQYWSDWKDLFLTAVNKFVPVKTIKDINSPQWIDGEVRQLVRKKYAALKKFRQNRSIIRKQKLRCWPISKTSRV